MTNTPTVAEVVTFELNDGVSDADFVRAAGATETIVREAPGFIRRRLSKGDDGRWTDYIEWETLELAHSAAKTLIEKPEFVPLMQAIKPETAVMRHETLMWHMG